MKYLFEDKQLDHTDNEIAHKSRRVKRLEDKERAQKTCHHLVNGSAILNTPPFTILIKG